MSGDQLNLDALDEMYHRGAQPTLDEGAALVAEVRRLRALEAEVSGVRGVVAGLADMDDQGGQWARGHKAAAREVLRELDAALGIRVAP